MNTTNWLEIVSLASRMTPGHLVVSEAISVQTIMLYMNYNFTCTQKNQPVVMTIGELAPLVKKAASTYQRQNDVNTLDEKLQESTEVHGTATMLSIPSSISEELSLPLEGSVVMSYSPLPVTDNSYVLGLRPIVCSDTYTQLDRASYVTGMLPFMK